MSGLTELQAAFARLTKSLCLKKASHPARPRSQPSCWQAVGDIKVPLGSRQELYKQLSGQGFSEGLQQWLGSNLVSVQDEAPDDKPGLTWTFNLAGARDMYRQAYKRRVQLSQPAAARFQLVPA